MGDGAGMGWGTGDGCGDAVGIGQAMVREPDQRWLAEPLQVPTPVLRRQWPLRCTHLAVGVMIFSSLFRRQSCRLLLLRHVGFSYPTNGEVSA